MKVGHHTPFRPFSSRYQLAHPPSFHTLPASYAVKRGDPGASVDTSAGASHVTREYQICLKCHSDHGYPDNNVYPGGNRPALGRSGGTPAGSTLAL